MASRKPKTVTLTQALCQLLGKTLLPDLRARAQEPAIAEALRSEHAREVRAERTADSFVEFQERTLEQVGAAWILSCVFVRTLEERGLLGRNRLAGEGAEDSEQLFFELAPSLTARDYLLTVFTELGSLPGAEDVLGARHNPLYRLSPSNDGARALLDFFRQQGDDGKLVWQFAGGSTRFLGDLYQDLSEHVRKRYALLQTPDFVESFILDQTLTPAITEFGYSEVRVIDPTCGSGHFLLGAFERLLDERLRNAPGVDVRTHALAALEQVSGVDVNPYAVAVARFRLTLAYLARAGFKVLAQAPKLKLNLVVADSLLHGAKDTQVRLTEQEEARGEEAAFGFEMFALDDPGEAGRVFAQRYHAVVGNPPYITCKDPKLKELYRQAYTSAAGRFALSAPFTERFFQLAVDGGYVGMINANSFMKREFGDALIEQVLPHLDLTRVIDAAGAYIPGHGTPTVLLFGRNRKPARDSVSAVLGKRPEPSTPTNPEHGLVWRSIADHFDEIGFDNDHISVAAVPRATLDHHPWSMGGGGTAELKERLESRATTTLRAVVSSIGFDTITRAAELLESTRRQYVRMGVEQHILCEYPPGESIRDWVVTTDVTIPVPYDRTTWSLLSIDALPGLRRFLWPHRFWLANRFVAGGTRMSDVGLPYWAIPQLPVEKHRTPLSIAFAFVATHNHFVLDRGGKVFNRSAPIIKLPESASEEDHLALLAYLNSSTACFWIKQVIQKRTNASQKHSTDPARATYEFAGTALEPLPIFAQDPRLIEIAKELAILACRRSDWLSGFQLVSDANNLASSEVLRSALLQGWQAYDNATARSVFRLS